LRFLPLLLLTLLIPRLRQADQRLHLPLRVGFRVVPNLLPGSPEVERAAPSQGKGGLNDLRSVKELVDGYLFADSEGRPVAPDNILLVRFHQPVRIVSRGDPEADTDLATGIGGVSGVVAAVAVEVDVAGVEAAGIFADPTARGGVVEA